MLNRISREYVTFRFARDEEILVPRSLVEKSRPLKNQLLKSHDNTLETNNIAHDTLDDVFRLLKQEEPIHTDAESMKKLVKALSDLELNELEKKMEGIQARIFQDPNASPSSLI